MYTQITNNINYRFLQVTNHFNLNENRHTVIVVAMSILIIQIVAYKIKSRGKFNNNMIFKKKKKIVACTTNKIDWRIDV